MQKFILGLVKQVFGGSAVTIEDKNIYGSVVPGTSSIAAEAQLQFFTKERLTDGEHLTNLLTKGKLPVDVVACIYGLTLTKTSGITQAKMKAFFDADPYLVITKNTAVLFEERLRMVPEEGILDIQAAVATTAATTTIDYSNANLKPGVLDIRTYNPITGEREPRILEGGVDFKAYIYFKSAFAGFAAATDKITLNLKCMYIQKKTAA